MPKMVEVVIDSVRVSLTNPQRIVVLREPNVERYLPIWIGPYEAEEITIALQEIEIARPRTHDLLKSVIHELNARLLRLEIVALREDVFYGELVVEANNHIVNIDCRPSDGLALAVRTHVPILVARDVLDAAGITPEEETHAAQNDAPASAPTSSKDSETGETSEERLSVFEDFLHNLDMDNLKPPSEPEDDEKPDPDDKPGKK
jgi:bifunctional DNase/RNase